ncbi:hypothetical protein GE107_11375 [Cohnella sp. CFH 77786]|uniref:hypothetical protein n=1 Tax=Cohnella sp. CFH 77786 TaxID=2662265 RepID=UPI001C608D96|nr:hypothetical protein [Cohnella sp. CFH 77786]MBW5446661.1 hypothetical protein [Cohnella sp. CFH 77786]
MPPGYTAFFLWVASAVLWWSGWREETADGIPDYAVAVFLAGWPLAAWLELPAGGHATVGGAFVWTALAVFALAWRMESPARWTAWSAGFLLGSLMLILTISPWLSIRLPEEMHGRAAGALTGAASTLLVPGAAGQVAAVTLAMSIPDLWRAGWLQAGGRLIGSGRWMESWWIAVLTARSLSVLAAFARRNVVSFGWRKGRESP